MRVKSGPSGARRTTGFASGEQARLTLFGAAAGPRLAWRVDYKATSREHYDGVVDATTGRLLWRANRVKSFTGHVFDYYLGAPDGGTLRDQDLTTPGWLPSTATNLTGPNAHTWSDINDDNVARAHRGGHARERRLQLRVHPVHGQRRAALPADPSAPWDPVGDRSSWQANRKQSATQAFFLVNKFHDHLAAAPIGFDAASGNFQGDDPLLNQSFDGADTEGDGGPDSDHADNANMDTPPDGQSPTMQLYLFEYLDAAAAVRLSRRRRRDGLARVHARPLEPPRRRRGRRRRAQQRARRRDGRGVERLVRRGPAGPRGARDRRPRRPAATSTSASRPTRPRTSPAPRRSTARSAAAPPTPTRPAPAARTPAPAATRSATSAKIAGGPEVHADGEIWVQTLWDLRQSLVDASAATTPHGSDAAELLITNGMRLSPPEPSMLEARNAILEADTRQRRRPARPHLGGLRPPRHGLLRVGLRRQRHAPGRGLQHLRRPTARRRARSRGRVFDSQTGLPLAGARVRLGAATDSGGNATLADTTGADGRYELDGVTEGTYGKLAVRSGSGGYDPVDVPEVVVAGR